jgi:hypothetical protein
MESWLATNFPLPDAQPAMLSVATSNSGLHQDSCVQSEQLLAPAVLSRR